MIIRYKRGILILVDVLLPEHHAPSRRWPPKPQPRSVLMTLAILASMGGRR